MNLIGWLLAAYISLFSAFGSSSADDVTVEEMPAPAATASPEAAPDVPAPTTVGQVEQRFLTRMPLPACGMVTATEQPGQAPPDTVWGCLQHAADTGAGAELIKVETTDGHPVLSYYRVEPHGRLEIYTDRRQDPRADRDWSYRECRPSADLRAAPCQGDS